MCIPNQPEEIVTAEKIQPFISGQPDKLILKDFRLILIGYLVLLLLLCLSQSLAFLLPLRLVLGIIYIILVPGYCLSIALFPKNEAVDGIERWGLSLGLSLAWVPVLALILNALPWGLRLWPVAIGELTSIIVFSALAIWRRMRLQTNEVLPPFLSWQPRSWWRSLPRPDRRTYIFIIAALTLTSLALAWTILVPTPDQFMTEFYMLGPSGLAEDFPQEVTVGEGIGVTLGIVNLERETHTYRVEVWAVDPFVEGRRQLLMKDGPYELPQGARKEWPINWQMPWPGENQEAEIFLFDGDRATPYRSLKLFLVVKP